MSDEEYCSVSELNSYIAGKFSKDSKLKTVYVSGEISDYTLAKSGHAYFYIKG